MDGCLHVFIRFILSEFWNTVDVVVVVGLPFVELCVRGGSLHISFRCETDGLSRKTVEEGGERNRST